MPVRMKKIFSLLLFFLLLPSSLMAEKWPDGSRMDRWFKDVRKVDFTALGPRFVLTAHGVAADSSLVQTSVIQRVIDEAASAGGGVIVVPAGTFLSGSLFFRPGTHLYLEDGAVLKGSDRIADFPLTETRIEGQTCVYFAALVNADGVDGFTIGGPGTIHGNGLHYWEEFWIRRKWNPQCTNKDAQRPRLVYVSNSRNVTLQDAHFVDSPFWTTHIYNCSRVRYLDVFIKSATDGVKGPSTDAVDIDKCTDVLISGCYMSVNDDAVALKGGKGTWADKAPENGPNRNILIENCRFGTVHHCLTLGSESIENRNVVFRNSRIEGYAKCMLMLKLRPDTPQRYSYVTVDGISGKCGIGVDFFTWTQFHDKGDRQDMPKSLCEHILVKNLDLDCSTMLRKPESGLYEVKDFRISPSPF